MRNVSAVNNLRGSERSIRDTSSGCDLAKDRNCRGLTLWRAIRWVFRYRNIVSLMLKLSVNPIISPVSILARNSSQAEKYCSSLRRKYRKMFASMKTGVWEGILRRKSVNACFLFRQPYNFFKGFVVDDLSEVVSKLRDNLRVFFFDDLDGAVIFVFHKITLSAVRITETYGFVNGKSFTMESLLPDFSRRFALVFVSFRGFSRFWA